MHKFEKCFFYFVCINWLKLVLKYLLKTPSIQLRKGKDPVLWIRIKDIGEKLDVKNISYLVYKKIKGKFETDYFTEQQIKKYKRHGSEFIEGIKFMYAHECIIIPA